MANSTILALLQNTLQGMGVAGFGQPTTLVGNTNQDIVQVLALINAEGDALAHERDWQAQQTQYIFSTPYSSYTGDVTSGSTTIASMSSTTGLTSDETSLSLVCAETLVPVLLQKARR